jgi:hypothetical protein
MVVEIPNPAAAASGGLTILDLPPTPPAGTVAPADPAEELAGAVNQPQGASGQYTVPGYLPPPMSPNMYPGGLPPYPGSPYDPAYQSYQPKTTAPGAAASLILGLVGLPFCGVVLGPIAIITASSAKGHIRRNPQVFTGDGMATAGMILGIVDIIVHVISAMFFMSSRY